MGFNWQIYMGSCSSSSNAWADWKFVQNPPERVSLHDDPNFPGIGKWENTERLLSTDANHAEKGLAIGAHSAKTYYTDDYSSKHYKFQRKPVVDGGYVWSTQSGTTLKRRIPGGAQNQDLAITITGEC